MSDETVIRREAAQKLWHVIDPELGVNIVDLGLIYEMYMENGTFIVVYTTTTPGCPMRRYLQRKVEEAVASIEGVDSYEARMVLDPEWSVEMIKPGVEFFSVPPPTLSDE